MRKDEFQKLLAETHERMFQLSATKGEEYSRSDNQLANFHRGAMEAGITPEQVWLVFFNKHIDAIKSYIRHGTIKSEPIEGRIDDAILYLHLFKAIVRERGRIPEQAGHGAGGVEISSKSD